MVVGVQKWGLKSGLKGDGEVYPSLDKPSWAMRFCS